MAKLLEKTLYNDIEQQVEYFARDEKTGELHRFVVTYKQFQPDHIGERTHV